MKESVLLMVIFLCFAANNAFATDITFKDNLDEHNTKRQRDNKISLSSQDMLLEYGKSSIDDDTSKSDKLIKETVLSAEARQFLDHSQIFLNKSGFDSKYDYKNLKEKKRELFRRYHLSGPEDFMINGEGFKASDY
ncbi:MAG: hypothetical protein ACRYGR_04625 [Janthinobacterium lividum]